MIIGLWPAHFVWTYYCLARFNIHQIQNTYVLYFFSVFPTKDIVSVTSRTKKIGLVLKTLALILFPLPLLLWPIAGIVGSFFGGIAYGFFTPLMATFEAVGVSVTSKCYHCFLMVHSPLLKGVVLWLRTSQISASILTFLTWMS